MYRRRDPATDAIISIILERLRVSPDAAREIAERIYFEVLNPAVEAERQEWIILSKSPPNRPSGSGWDS